jgi:hypothetical protein
MRLNKPRITSSGSALNAIQGQPTIVIVIEKSSSFADSNAVLIGIYFATVNAYQADE